MVLLPTWQIIIIAMASFVFAFAIICICVNVYIDCKKAIVWRQVAEDAERDRELCF